MSVCTELQRQLSAPGHTRSSEEEALERVGQQMLSFTSTCIICVENTYSRCTRITNESNEPCRQTAPISEHLRRYRRLCVSLRFQKHQHVLCILTNFWSKDSTAVTFEGFIRARSLEEHQAALWLLTLLRHLSYQLAKPANHPQFQTKQQVCP